ncbi:MAG: proprotein convertase P-domain-containing protein [Deltaproteobacteria bacterium]|nr:proprotein convertase P-domain-containing protein [Deltaproteobacteria bacterium]
MPKGQVEVHIDYSKYSNQMDAKKAALLSLNDRAKLEVPASGEDLNTFVRNNAWGHHASCTCKIGDDIIRTWTSDDFAVHGEEVRGDWTIHIVDKASADVGRLLHWQLRVRDLARVDQGQLNAWSLKIWY